MMKIFKAFYVTTMKIVENARDRKKKKGLKEERKAVAMSHISSWYQPLLVRGLSAHF